jgi:hypothetical protein
MAMTERVLSYQIPLVGTVEAVLHAEAAALFDRLEGSGEVGRLRHLDHLGAVRLAVEGAHHPRWEYVVTTLALIHRAKRAHGIALSGPATAGRFRFSSGSELLSCWSLLLNTGHIKWTFAAERVLLQELWRQTAARASFEAKLSPIQRAGLRSVLKAGDPYRLYPFVAAHRLPITVGGDLTPWSAAIDAYVQPDSDQIRRLRQLYRALRRIAYLALDTTYAPSYVRLSLSQLLSDPQAYRRLAIAARDVDEAELAGLDAFMSRQIYLAEPVLRIAAERDYDLRRLIRSSLKRGVSPTIERLAAGVIQDRAGVEKLRTVVRSNFRMQPPFDLFEAALLNPRQEEVRIKGFSRNRRGRAAASIWQVLGGSEWIIQVHTPPLARFQAAAIAAYAQWADARRQRIAKEWTRPREPQLRDHEFIQSAGVDSVARDLLLDVFRTVFVRELRWEWGNAGWAGAAVLGPGKIARGLIGLELRRVGRDAVERRAELQLLQRVISRGDPLVVATIGRLTGFDRDTDEPVVEFDGVCVREQDLGLQVVVVEAKVGRASSAAAKRQLQKQLRVVKPIAAALLSEIVLLPPLAGEPRGSRAKAELLIPYD